MKTKSLLAAFVLFAMAAFSFAQNPAEQQIRTLENQESTAFANADSSWYVNNAADNCTWTGVDGTVVTKPEILKFIQLTPAEFKGKMSLQKSDLTVKMYGDSTAIATYNVVQGQSAVGSHATNFRDTDLWVMQNGTWKLVSQVQTYNAGH